MIERFNDLKYIQEFLVCHSCECRNLINASPLTKNRDSCIRRNDRKVVFQDKREIPEKYMDLESYKNLELLSDELGRMLNGLQKSLRGGQNEA